MAKSNSNNMASLIATIIVALLAAVAVFFLVWTMSETEEPEQVIDGEYIVNEDLAAEMKIEATELLKKNHEIFELFFVAPISHEDEPYGNVPEDGFYTCITDDSTYKTMQELTDLVNSVFAAEQAELILTNPMGDGPTYSEQSDGTLGISATFTSYPVKNSWENVNFTVTPTSETSCDLSVTLTVKETGEEVVKDVQIVKTDGQWLLSKLVY